jgi:hypothetical protein
MALCDVVGNIRQALPHLGRPILPRAPEGGHPAVVILIIVQQTRVSELILQLTLSQLHGGH